MGFWGFFGWWLEQCSEKTKLYRQISLDSIMPKILSKCLITALLCRRWVAQIGFELVSCGRDALHVHRQLSPLWSLGKGIHFFLDPKRALVSQMYFDTQLR